jgi:hypothetical protein
MCASQEDMMPSTIDQQMTAAWTDEMDAVDARLAPQFGRAESGSGPAPMCAVCPPAPSARTAGSLLKRWDMPRRMGFSTRRAGRAGMPTRYAMSCATT